MSKRLIALLTLLLVSQVLAAISELVPAVHAQDLRTNTPTPTIIVKKPTATPTREAASPTPLPSRTPIATSTNTHTPPSATPSPTSQPFSTSAATASPTDAGAASSGPATSTSSSTASSTSTVDSANVPTLASPTSTGSSALAGSDAQGGAGSAASSGDEPKRPPRVLVVWGSGGYRFILILILLLLVAAPFVIGRLWNNPKPPPAKHKAGSGDGGPASRPVGSPKFTDLVLERGITLTIDSHDDLDMYLVNAPGGPAPPPGDDPTYSAGHFVLDLDRSPMVHEIMHAITQAYQAQFHAPLRLKMKLLQGHGGVELSESLRGMIDTLSMNNGLDPAEVETALKDLGQSAGTSGQRGGGERSLPGVTIYVDLND